MVKSGNAAIIVRMHADNARGRPLTLLIFDRKVFPLHVIVVIFVVYVVVSLEVVSFSFRAS